MFLPRMGVLCQLLWRLGTVGSRCLALVLYASVYHGWVFLFAMLHWVCMLTWLVMQVRKQVFFLKNLDFPYKKNFI